MLSVLIVALTEFFLDDTYLTPLEARDDEQVVQDELDFLYESEAGRPLVLLVSHAADHLAQLRGVELVVLFRLCCLFDHSHLAHSEAERGFLFADSNVRIFREEAQDIFLATVLLSWSVVVLKKASDAVDVGFKHVGDLQLIAILVPKLLPRLENIVGQNDLLHEFLDGFGVCRHYFLIRVLALSYSSNDLNEFVAHQDVGVHSWHGQGSVLRCDVLSVDLRCTERAFTRLVWQLDFVAEGSEVNPADLRVR